MGISTTYMQLNYTYVVTKYSVFNKKREQTFLFYSDGNWNIPKLDILTMKQKNVSTSLFSVL